MTDNNRCGLSIRGGRRRHLETKKADKKILRNREYQVCKKTTKQSNRERKKNKPPLVCTRLTRKGGEGGTSYAFYETEAGQRFTPFHHRLEFPSGSAGQGP